MKKFLLLMLASGFLLFSSGVSAFEDTDAPSLSRLLERGVLTDAPAFSPESSCTRADFVEWALKNTGQDGNSSATEPFVDVKATDIFFPFIAAAWEMGVLDEAKIFFPDRTITKGEALKIVLLLEGVPLPRGGFQKIHDFLDLETLSEKSIAEKALEMRLVRPKSEIIFGKKSPLTREECAKLLDAVALQRTSEAFVFEEYITEQEEGMIERVRHLLEHKYFPKEQVDSEKLIEAAIKGMVSSLEDPYSVYFSPEEAEAFLTGVGIGNSYGIGAQVGTDAEGRVIIMKPLRGSPAEKAGFQSGDVLSRINGEDVLSTKLPIEAVIQKIKGAEGTTVEIEILRRKKAITKILVRAPIQPESVLAFPFEQLLVIQVDFFGQETRDDIEKGILEYPEQAKKGIILDLRGNPGGLLQSAIDVLGLFLPKDSVVLEIMGNDSGGKEFSEGEGAYQDIPLVVLVDDFSASASEIVAGALQDHGRAAILGKITFGKGSAQDFLGFDDGSALKLTIAEWFTPSGKAVNDIGITPDYLFENIADSPKAFSSAAKVILRNQWKKAP